MRIKTVLFLFFLFNAFSVRISAQQTELLTMLDSLITDTSMTDNVYLNLEILSELNDEVEKYFFRYYRRGNYQLYYNNDIMLLKDGNNVMILEEKEKNLYFYTETEGVNKLSHSEVDPLKKLIRGKIIKIQTEGKYKEVTCESVYRDIKEITYVLDTENALLKEVKYYYNTDVKHGVGKKQIIIKYIEVKRLKATDPLLQMDQFLEIGKKQVKPLGKYVSYNFLDLRNK